jgi:hypothetical protein
MFRMIVGFKHARPGESDSIMDLLSINGYSDYEELNVLIFLIALKLG